MGEKNASGTMEPFIGGSLHDPHGPYCTEICFGLVGIIVGPSSGSTTLQPLEIILPHLPQC